jgi:4-hydroxy-3-polyprenylbenzoate decarboxylase
MNLVLAITGATGVHAAQLLLEKSPWPVTLLASRYGKDVCRRERVPFESLAEKADAVMDDEDLAAAISSGSVPTAGMVILPCSTNTLAKVAAGIADTLITRAAHCHLKERRKLVLCVRESPWTLIDIDNARHVAAAGGIIMPISPPFYMAADRPPQAVTMTDLLEAFVDRVLTALGSPAGANWETVS